MQFMYSNVCLKTLVHALETEGRKMSIVKSIVSVFILLAVSIVIGVSIQAQPQPNRNNTRQVGNMLQRLERSSSRFRNSLNLALVQRSVDQTRKIGRGEGEKWRQLREAKGGEASTKRGLKMTSALSNPALISLLSSSGISSLAGLRWLPTLRASYKRRCPSIAS